MTSLLPAPRRTALPGGPDAAHRRPLILLGGLAGLAAACSTLVVCLAGGVIVYGFFTILATLTFWVVRADNILVIFLSVYEAGRWPVTIYPGALRYALTFLVPVAFAADPRGRRRARAGASLGRLGFFARRDRTGEGGGVNVCPPRHESPSPKHAASS